jgi:hypothetical protein
MKKTNRRAVITGIAAGATALTLAAVPGLALPVDPVFAAIDAHRAAIAEFNRLLALDMAVGDCSAIEAALRVEVATAKALVATAPTTRAGLRALAAHLREDDSFLALRFIQHPQTLEWWEKFGKLTTEARDRDLVDWFITQRAAELAA